MLNHDTGHMDWDHGRVIPPVTPGSSYYINPENMYDISTPRGRELMDEVRPSESQAEISEGTNGWVVFVIAVIIMLGFFVIPGHS